MSQHTGDRASISFFSVSDQADRPTRLILTWPALTGASNIYVLLTGSNKAQALRHVVGEAPDDHLYPAARIRLAEGAVIWWVDKEAAGGQLS